MSSPLKELQAKQRELNRKMREAARLAGSDPAAEAAQRHRELVAAKGRAGSAAVADIGDIPPVKDPARRERCRLDLFAYLTTYFPNSTGLSPFSDDHRRAISRLQGCILEGGRFVEAMYRGSAKTTIGENSALWATSYGHRRYVPIFGADANAASGNIDSIKMELSENDLLYEDFPEICHAIRALEGKPQRCASQTFKGVQTHIEWTAETVVLPMIPGSVASGGIITTRGITGGSRGMKHKRPDGTQQRPDFAFIDDPQTDESAASPIQVGKRLSILRKSLLKLGGHGRQLAVFIAATVIERDDMIDQLLDAKKNPSWQGERIPMVRAWATEHEKLWLGEYAKLRNTYDPFKIGDQARAHADATKFYADRRAEMDAGAVVSWENCYDHATEISAVQHAYNALIDDGPEVFASEYQNQPLVAEETASELAIDQVAAKVNGFNRGEVPLATEQITMHIDVQETLLYFSLVAWAAQFTGPVIDYGGWPDQKTHYFTLADARYRLRPPDGAGGTEAALFEGLRALTELYVGRDWRRDDGARMRVGLCLIDANYSTDVVHDFCRQNRFGEIVMPSHGRFVGASSVPFSEYKRKPGERTGPGWRVPIVRGKRVVRHALYDTNYWKSFVHQRFTVPMGDPGCMSLFKGTPELHRMFAEQFTAEYRVRTEGRGRTVDEWKPRPNQPDNHFLDNIVGCAVAASMLGISMVGAMADHQKKKPRYKLSELQARRSA